MQAPYSHSQQPHAVASRPKYREPTEAENMVLANNIMYDKRVVRGNTYAAQILPATAQAEQLEMERKSQMQKSAKRAKPPPKPDTPPAADGRKHIDVQTEQYLEELTDRPIEADIETQTDAFMDQLPAPIFIPMKTGVDVETQIYDGDLFDFDAEVDPILEVRVCMHAGFAGRGARGGGVAWRWVGGRRPPQLEAGIDRHASRRVPLRALIARFRSREGGGERVGAREARGLRETPSPPYTF